MTWTYLNKEFLRREEVKISPFDRGFLFGDGVYEVIPVYEEKAFLLEDHLARLGRSLNSTGIKNPQKWNDIPGIIHELVKINTFSNQSVYIQVTRGEDSIRNHIPDPKVQPTLFITSSELKVNPYRLDPQKKGLEVKTLEDPRWNRCDIKAVTLLSNIMAMKEANLEGNDGVIFCADGEITEGARTSAYKYLGLSYNNQSLIFINTRKISDEKDLENTIVHELVHQRFPYLSHGKRFTKLVRQGLRGRKFPPYQKRK